MTASEQNAQIQDALRRFLPSGGSSQAIEPEFDSNTAQALEAKVADALKKYPFLPRFRLIERAGNGAAERNARDIIGFVYALDKPAGEACIELPIGLVKAAFIGSLGGAFAVQSNPARQDLTTAERRFAEFLARGLAVVAAPPAGTAAIDRIVHTDSAEQAEKPGDLQAFQFAATSDGTETSFTIYLPSPPEREKAAPSHGSRMAEVAGRMVVAPEVRLQLRGMTLSEVAGLKHGDVISVSADNAGAPGQILVERKAVFACELGQIGDRYSARITGPVAASARPQITDFQDRSR